MLSALLWFVKSERRQIKDDIDGVKDEIASVEKRAILVGEQMRDQQARIEKDLHALRESLPDRYVSRTDWAEFRGWLQALLTRIEVKLDAKVDRNDCARFHNGDHQ